MAQICPRCGGLEVGCPICDAPPKHEEPFIPDGVRAVPLMSEVETTWEVQGVDLSAWNGIMDFNILKTKAQYLSIRLGYGDGWKDSRCDTYRTQAIDADMPYFGYWYVKAGQNADSHANGFASVAAEKTGIIGLEEDYEYTSLVDKIATLNWIVSFHNKLRVKTALKCTAYSNWNFWANKVAPNTLFTEEQWVANWTLGSVPYMPPGWTWKKGCKWQWSADGNGKAHEYGMISDGDVDMDLDRYYGTVAEFNARYSTHILPIGQIAPPVLPAWFYANGVLNIRSTPDSRPYTNNIIGSMQLDSKWKPYAIASGYDDYGGVRDWWKINEYAYVAKWRTRW